MSESLSTIPKPRVYVAGPITSSGDLISNVRRGIRLGKRLMNKGYVPFVPHLSEFFRLVCPTSWSAWLAYDEQWIPVCHAVYRLKGYSKGANREEELAKKLGLPIFREFSDLERWKTTLYYKPHETILAAVGPSSLSAESPSVPL